jgi:DNA-binding response OmpR family regulator
MPRKTGIETNPSAIMTALSGIETSAAAVGAVLSISPILIVTSRLADEYLWAEALNVGAYDVLAKPFEREEVIRIVSLASRSWHDRHHRGRVPKTPRLHAA